MAVCRTRWREYIAYAATGTTLIVKHLSDPHVANPATKASQTRPLWYAHAFNRPVFYQAIARYAPLLPRPMRLTMARTMATVLYHCMPREYAAAQRNLAHILPTASGQEIAQRARQLFRNFACFFVDLLSTNRCTLSGQQRYLGAVHGVDHLQHALASPRGFVAATAHLGNWELAGRLLGSYGKTVHVLMAPEQNQAIQHFLRGTAGLEHVRFVTNEGGAVFVQLLMALRRGDVVAVQADRAMGHRSDIPVPFFGTPALFPLGPFVLARAAQVPVLPCFCFMRPDDCYDIFVEEAIPVAHGHEAAALHHMVRVIERYVARAPEQWCNFYDVWDAIPV